MCLCVCAHVRVCAFFVCMCFRVCLFSVHVRGLVCARVCKSVSVCLPTAMDKIVVTPALLSDNAPLLPENCFKYKFFGIHILTYIACIRRTQKNHNCRKKPNADRVTHPSKKVLNEWIPMEPHMWICGSFLVCNSVNTRLFCTKVT